MSELTLEDVELLIDFGDLFAGIWGAVEYGHSTEHYKQQILALCNQVLVNSER